MDFVKLFASKVSDLQNRKHSILDLPPYRQIEPQSASHMVFSACVIIKVIQNFVRDLQNYFAWLC